jgi:hypothetical protein
MERMQLCRPNLALSSLSTQLMSTRVSRLYLWYIERWMLTLSSGFKRRCWCINHDRKLEWEWEWGYVITCLADGRMGLDGALMASVLDGNISSCCHTNFGLHLIPQPIFILTSNFPTQWNIIWFDPTTLISQVDQSITHHFQNLETGLQRSRLDLSSDLAGSAASLYSMIRSELQPCHFKPHHAFDVRRSWQSFFFVFFLARLENVEFCRVSSRVTCNTFSWFWIKGWERCTVVLPMAPNLYYLYLLAYDICYLALSSNFSWVVGKSREKHIPPPNTFWFTVRGSQTWPKEVN